MHEEKPPIEYVQDNGWGFDFARGGKWHFIRGGKALCGRIELPAGTDLATLAGQFPDRLKPCCRECVIEFRASDRQPDLFARAG